MKLRWLGLALARLQQWCLLAARLVWGIWIELYHHQRQYPPQPHQKQGKQQLVAQRAHCWGALLLVAPQEARWLCQAA